MEVIQDTIDAILIERSHLDEHSDEYYNLFPLVSRYEEELDKRADKEKELGTFESLSEQNSIKDYAGGYSVSFLQNFKTKPREVIEKALENLYLDLQNTIDPVESEDILENIAIMAKLLEEKDNESGPYGGSSGTFGPFGGPCDPSDDPSSSFDFSKDKGKGKAKE